jgi:hypothetical protein
MDASVTVLIVEPEAQTRERLGGLAEAAGFEVLSCPGPHAPTYDCIGVLRDGCPLADAADAVVMDMELDSDLAIQGTGALELVGFYLKTGKAVVALCRDDRDLVHPYVEDWVSLLRWPADEELVIPALVEITARRDAS